MDYYNLDGFVSELNTLIGFFSEIAAKEEELLTFGMKQVIDWKSYKDSKELFDNFDAKIFELLHLARPIDIELSLAIQDLVKESKVAELIGIVYVNLRIAENKSTPRAFLSVILRLPYLRDFLKQKRLFTDEVISIHNILVALNRMVSYTKRLQSVYYSNWHNDNNIFKPSNLDSNKILLHIDNAIINIQDSSVLTSEQRKELIQYLTKAKADMAGNYPSWNSVVGALLISATLLSGVADAPQAYQNLNAAISHILGRSIERPLLPSLPVLNGSPEGQKQKSLPESTIV